MNWKAERTGGYKGQGESSKRPQDEGLDRVSMVGSVRSDMSLTAADRKLESLKAEVARLNEVTKRQQDTIERLQRIVSNLQVKRHK
jgi:predicted nuclease with TOPRIM domain